MPIYPLKCLSCGTVSDTIMGISELDGLDPECLDLEDLGVACPDCGKYIFKKEIAAHGRTAHNWSEWQRDGK